MDNETIALDTETVRMLGLGKSEELVQKINQRRLNCPNLNPHNWFLELLQSITSNELGKLKENNIDVEINRDYISVEYDAEPLSKAETVRFATGWYSWQISMHTTACYADINSVNEDINGEVYNINTSINIRSEKEWKRIPKSEQITNGDRQAR